MDVPEDELLHLLHNPDFRRRVLYAGELQDQRVRKRWFVLIVSGLAVLALVAAWYGAPPPARKAEEASEEEEAVRGSQQWGAYHSAFRSQLGDTPDAAWLLLQPNMSAALSAAAGGGAPLHERWTAALEGALAAGYAKIVQEWDSFLRPQAEAVARQRRLLGARRKSAAAKAVDQLRRPLACHLRLLQLAADFAAGWAAQQSWQQQHPPGSNSAAAVQEQQVRLTDVQIRVGDAHLWLLGAHNFLARASSSAAQERLISTLAAEVAAQHAYKSLGWHWEGVHAVVAEAQLQFGEAWWQPAAGQQPCWEEWGALRPLYRPGGDGVPNRPQRKWWQRGDSPKPSVAELLETGTLGDWVQHLASAAYNESSFADVALVAGELAVLPRNSAVAWALPDNLPVDSDSAWWSPPFALADTLWRLVALSDGVCLHLALMPDRPLHRPAQLHVRAASAVNVDVHHSLAPVLPDPPFCRPLFYGNGLAPTFEVAWLSPNHDALTLERNGPGPSTLDFAAGEHQHRPLPGCWLMDMPPAAPSGPQPWWQRAGWGNPQQQARAQLSTLVVAQLELAQPDGSSAAAAAPASPLPSVPAANGTGALLSSSRYARLLSQQARLPPASPGFNSSLLRQPELPDLVGAVLAVANSTIHSCPWAGLLKKPAVITTQSELMTMLAQTVPGLEERGLRRERMAVTAAPSSSVGWRGRWAALRRGAQQSLGSWIEWGMVQLLRALRSQAARAVAGPALLLLLLV